MLSGVLRSDVAIQVSIRIMNTFVEMRRFIANNALLFAKVSDIELKQPEYQKSTDERSRAMWCANLIDYPFEKDSFEKILDYAANKYEDNPFVATTDEGKVVGFFCYSLDLTTNEGMLKFVIVSPSERGTGKGKEMLKLAVLWFG